MATKLDTVFYEIEARTANLKPGVDQAKKAIAELTNKVAKIEIKADAAQAKKTIEDTTKAAVASEEKRAAAAKSRAEKEAKASDTARQRLEKETRAMALLEIEAHKLNDALDATRKKSVAAGAGTSFDQFTGKLLETKDAVQGVDLSIDGLARNASAALKNPALAASIVVAALVTLTSVAVRSAAAFEESFLGVRATLDKLTGTELASLKRAVTDLSKETPRAAEGLAGIAGALSKMGQSDPAEIAKDLRTLALAGDALGATDLLPLANTLDLLSDAFGLTAEAARQAFVQIVAMTQGRIDLDEFSNVLSRSATRMSALGVSAQETAAAITTLIDAGVNSRQITTGLIDLLDKSARAERDAVDALEANKEGDAKALTIFAETVNAANIESKGLVGTLGELFRALDGDLQKFTQANLSLNDYQIAQKAAAATTEDGKNKILSYDEAVAKLTRSAEINRESASALVGVLKNELSAVLVDLGSVFLPPLIAALKVLAGLFNSTKEAARDADEYFTNSTLALAKFAEQRANGIENVVQRTRALSEANKAANEIVQRPQILEADGTTVESLRNKQGTLRAAQTLNKGIGSGESKLIADALKLVEDRLKALTGAAFQVEAALPKVDKQFANTGNKAAAAAKEFESAVRSAKEFAQGLDGVADPVGIAAAKIELLREQLLDIIKELPEAKQAAARAEADTIFDQMADGLERLRAANIDSINGKLDQFTKKLSSSAVEAVVEEYREYAKTLEEIARAAKLLGTPVGDAQAAKALAIAAALQKQGDQLVNVAGLQQDYNEALKVAADFANSSDAAYRGSTITLEKYRGALQVLADTETKARVIANDLTQDEKVRTEALKLANEALARRKQLEPGGTETTVKAVSDTNLLAVALGIASQNARALTDNLGESGNALARVADLGVKAANIIKAISVARKAEEAAKLSGNAMSSAEKLSNKADWISLVVGGVLEIAGAMDLFGTKAKKRAAEMRKLADEFNSALAAFARGLMVNGLVNELSKAREALADEIGKLVAKVNAAAGFQEVAGPSNAASIRAQIAVQEAERKRQLAIAQNDKEDQLARMKAGAAVAGLTRYIDNLTAVANQAAEAEARLAAAHDKQVKQNIEDLAVRQLIAQGRDEEADQLQRDLENKRLLAAASNVATQADIDYYRALKQTIEIEDAAREAAKRDPLKEFQNRAKLFGIAGADYLNGLIEATKKKFGSLTGVLDGLDLSTQSGLDALMERGKALYAQMLENDGFISESEQAILDGLHEIYSTAVDVFDSIAERVQRALSKVDDDNEILGGDAGVRFGRDVNAVKGINAQLDAILGSVDISTSAGAESFRSKLQGLYTSLLDGGLTAEEEIVRDLIKRLLGSLTDAVSESEQIANDAIEKANDRRRDRGDRTTAVTDVEGVPAFVNFLTTLPPALANLFGQFNVNNLAGIDAAKAKLVELSASIEGLSDEQIFEQFGMTREQLVSAIYELDSSFDGLKSSALSAAQAQLDLANANREFASSVQDDFLRASGDNQTADINASKERTNNKLAKAKELNASPDVIAQIVKTGELDIININRRYEQQAAAAIESVSRDAVQAVSSAASRSDFVGAGLQGSTSEQVLRLTDYAASQLVELREIKFAALQGIALLGAMLSGSLPTRSVPALPQGGFSGASAGITLIVNINGPITGMSPEDAAGRFGEASISIINQGLYRAAGIEAARTGESL